MTVYDQPTLSTAHKSAQAYPAVAEWLDERELEGKAPRTLDGDERYTAELLVAYPHLELHEIGPAQLKAFLTTKPPASRRKYAAHFKSLFRWAVLNDILDVNPMDKVPAFERPKQKLVPTFDDAEIELLTGLPDPDGILYLVLFDTGLRSSEARAMQVKHVRFDAERATIAVPSGKGGKGRVLPATDRLMRRLNDWFLLDALKRDAYLWPMRRGGHELTHDRMIGPTSIKNWHTRSCAAAGVRYRKLHATRHTFATRALRRGVSLTAVSRIMGHASVKTTSDEYVHLVVDDLAAELELLEV